MSARVRRLGERAGVTGQGARVDPGVPPRSGARSRSGRPSASGPAVGAGASFPAAITRVSGALRSGVPPALAWHRALGVRTDGGVPVPADLMTLCPGDPAPALAVLASARLAADLGAAPATVLDRVALALAADAEAAGQREAALAGPRATATLLVWLPAVGVVLGFALGADPLAVLLDGGSGTLLLIAGVLLTLVGRHWTARCLRTAVRAAGEC